MEKGRRSLLRWLGGSLALLLCGLVAVLLNPPVWLEEQVLRQVQRVQDEPGGGPMRLNIRMGLNAWDRMHGEGGEEPALMEGSRAAVRGRWGAHFVEGHLRRCAWADTGGPLRLDLLKGRIRDGVSWLLYRQEAPFWWSEDLLALARTLGAEMLRVMPVEIYLGFVARGMRMMEENPGADVLDRMGAGSGFWFRLAPETELGFERVGEAGRAWASGAGQKVVASFASAFDSGLAERVVPFLERTRGLAWLLWCALLERDPGVEGQEVLWVCDVLHNRIFPVLDPLRLSRRDRRAGDISGEGKAEPWLRALLNGENGVALRTAMWARLSELGRVPSPVHEGWMPWLGSRFLRRRVLRNASVLLKQTGALILRDIPLSDSWLPEEWKNWVRGEVVRVPEGRHLLRQALDMPAGWRMELAAGAEIRAAAGVWMRLRGGLEVFGTPAKPVTVGAADRERGWGGLILIPAEGCRIRIRHLEVSDADGRCQGGMVLPGAVTQVGGELIWSGGGVRRGGAEGTALAVMDLRVQLEDLFLVGAQGLRCTGARGVLDHCRIDAAVLGVYQWGGDLRLEGGDLTGEGCGLELGASSVMEVGPGVRVGTRALAALIRGGSRCCWRAPLPPGTTLVVSGPETGGAVGGLMAPWDPGDRRWTQVRTDPGCWLRTCPPTGASGDLLRTPWTPPGVPRPEWMALNGIPARRGVGCLAFWLPEGLPGDRDRGDLGWKEHEGVDAEQWVDGTEGRWGTWSALGKVAAPLVLPRSRIFSWRRWKGGWCASLDVLVATGHLPLIQVDTVGRDFWVPQEIPNEPKVPCRLRGWFPEGEPCSQGWWGAGVEGRGKRLEKWKYGFRLDQSVSLAGMRSSRHWVLESAFSEGTLLRPRLAYELARVLPLRHGEMPLAPETRYVDLVVNGGYQGVFLLMEHVDENFLHFPRHNPLNDYPALLFRGKDDNALIAPENVEREVRGAYRALPGGRTPLFKGDDPIHGWHNGYAQRFPEPEGFGYFWQPLDEWLLFLNMSSTPDFERVVAQKMDMDAFRDLWVWTQAIDDGDGLGKNRYWAREEGRMARWFVIPWDKDGVLGRDQGGGARPAEGWLHTSLLDRCLAIPSFREGFRARWLSLRTGAWSDEALQKLFDGARGALGGAWRRDVARWPKRSGALWTPERYQSEVAAILPWIRDRWRWLDELVRYL